MKGELRNHRSCAEFVGHGSKSDAVAAGCFKAEENSVSVALWQHSGPNGEALVPELRYQQGMAKFENGDPLQQSCLDIKIEIDEEAGASSSRTNREEPRRIVDSLAHRYGDAVQWHSCDKCAAKFPLKTMLKRHKISHNCRRNEEKIKESSKSRPRRSSTKKFRAARSRYICHICDFGCDKRGAMSFHLEIKHGRKIAAEEENFECDAFEAVGGRGEIFRCEVCSFECKKRGTLVSHVKRKHARVVKLEIEEEVEPDAYECVELDPTPGRSRTKSSLAESLKCNSCGFECTNRSTLYSHKRRHRAKEASEVYSCNECDFKTAKKTSLYSHIKRKHKPPRASNDTEQPTLFSCSQCDYKNKNKYELKVHVARKHTDDFKFSCETCSKKFKVKGDLTNHVRFSHREQPVICDVCGKTCLNSNSLYVHQKFAHYKAKYECQMCKRRMVSQENLDEHMLRQHEKRENVVCEECGKTFSRNSRLKIHMRIHTGDKPYDCTVCNKSFARRTALKQHLLIHTGMRPYVCDICGKAFTQKPGLISHRKSHPGPLPPLPRVLIDHILNDVLRPNL